MAKSIFINIFGLLVGIGIGYFFVLYPLELDFSKKQTYHFEKSVKTPEKQVIGFLPYWLLGKAQSDYSNSITQLAYFAISPDVDGSIKKLDNPLEQEPGWYTLSSGKADSFFEQANKNKQSLSLVVFSGDREIIDQLIATPETSSQNLLDDVLPLMSKYGFSDLNLDLERVGEASSEARLNFTKFVGEVKQGLTTAKAGTLTVDITGADLIRQNLTSPKDIGKIADFIVIMTYDYHYSGSMVTGSVAPLAGAGTISEYDVQAAVEKALAIIPPEKIILGVPLYGYEWESLGKIPRSATIPSSGITASNQRVEALLANCSTCSAQLDTEAQEEYLIYKDQLTDTYHQIFYPTSKATQAKVDFVLEQNLAGMALWALGYEGKTILSPLREYVK